MRKILPFLIYSSLLNWDLLAALFFSKLNGDAKRGCMCGKPHVHLKLTGYSHVATWYTPTTRIKEANSFTEDTTKICPETGRRFSTWDLLIKSWKQL